MRAPILTFKRARALRDLTLPEGLLWREIQGKKVAGLRFRCQHPMGPYILDFYCPAAKLCVEVDGSGHATAEAAAHDERRRVWLNMRGVRVLRFEAKDILSREGFEWVLETIAEAAAPSTAARSPSPAARVRN